MSPARALVVCLASLTACTDDSAATDPSADPSTGGSSGGDATTAGPDTSTGTPTTGSEASSSGESGFEPPEPVCGNGYLEADEECDDANAADGDGCTAACLVPCGLELEVLELAPTAQSFIGGVAVAPGVDGDFVVIGHRREITVDQEMMSTVGPRQVLVLSYDRDGASQWKRSFGTDVQDLDIEGGTVDAAGDVLLIGTMDGADATDIWVAKLSGEDGSELWSRSFDGAFEGADAGVSIATTPDGDVVAVGNVLSAVNDTDVWVGKLAGADGEPIWTTTWSGAPNEGYSPDVAGEVGVAPDGGIYVLSREFVSHDIFEATVIKLGPDGGAPLWTATPLASDTEHKNDPGPLAVGPDGAVVFALEPLNAADEFTVVRYAPDGGAPTWSLAVTDFADKGTAWVLGGVGVFPDGGIVVGGTWYDNVSEVDSGWYEVWTARLDPDGGKRCQVSYRSPGEDLVPPSLFVSSFSAGADGAALATGERIQNSESSVWTGRFRPL